MTDRIAGSAKGRYISLSTQTTIRVVPHSYPLILLDRIKACYPEEGVGQSVKHITMTDPVLSGHFPGFPIYPGVLIIEAMVQNACMTATLRELYRSKGSLEALLDYFHGVPDAGKQYVLAEVRAKLIQPIFPGHAMDLEARLLMERDGMYAYKVSAHVENVEAARGQVTMAEVPTNLTQGQMDRIGNG